MTEISKVWGKNFEILHCLLYKKDTMPFHRVHILPRLDSHDGGRKIVRLASKQDTIYSCAPRQRVPRYFQQFMTPARGPQASQWLYIKCHAILIALCMKTPIEATFLSFKWKISLSACISCYR